MSSTASDPIIVVGAGWAGLSAALGLARQGKKVLVLEAAPQSGGRARSIRFGDQTVDNGQHLLIGAYRQTLTLLKWLDIPESAVLLRTPLDFYTIDINKPKSPFHIKLSNLPFPLQWFSGFISTHGISISERLWILKFFFTLYKMGFKLSKDISVQELLLNLHQSEALITKLWAPMALAALTTPIDIASANVFLQVLKDTFTTTRSDSDWLFPKTDLSTFLPDPILSFLKTKSCKVEYSQRVEALIIEEGKIKGVKTASREIKGQSVILATPPHTTSQILKKSTPTECQNLIENLSHFQYQPITTVYLQYSHPLNLKIPMLGLINGTGHWLLDKQISAQPNILSVVISGIGPHSTLSHSTLVEKITEEISTLLPILSKLEDYRVICEKRAAFSCTIGISERRPSNATPIKNLILAGDYTQTGYPSTLEGAIQSGIKASELL